MQIGSDYRSDRSRTFGRRRWLMGLAVSLGVLACDPDADAEGIEWLQENFRHVNRVLAVHGLPPHSEPERLPDFPYRGQPLSFPYAWVHYLRRAVAFAR